MINNILIVFTLLVGFIVLYMKYQKAKLTKVEVLEDDFRTIDKVVEAVKLEMIEIIKDDYTLGLSDSEFNALYKRKARIQEALKNCVFGIDSAKAIVIELIRGYLAENLNPDLISELLGLGPGQDPSDHVKFEILMYRYKKKYGKQALGNWLNNYGFANERKNIETNDFAYFVTIEDLHMTYEEENIQLDNKEKLDVLAVLVYQLYKGFGIVDTLREMDVNGFNMGTSGSILSNVTKDRVGLMKATNSVWLYFQGKYIHLRFMNLGSEDELKRIVQLLVRYNNPGPLTAKRGYLVNTMYDKSRILAIRPPASEYWAIFVRKFGLSDVSPEALIVKPYTKRGDLAINLIEFLMRGQITCAVTGRQGSGKTTLMSSIIRYIDPRYTIRVLEMAPELYLRELYPTRNILSVQETTTVTAAELQDALKKSDAAVSIVGEVATDVIAARMIQMGMTASLFTVFSHHANTPRDLVFTIRNSLVNAGGFSNMDTAERQVTEVVKCDIHLDYTPDGKRFIARVSEIIPLEEAVPYPEVDKKDINVAMAEITREYYTRSTDRISFWTHELLVYDIENHEYKPVDRISPALESKIRLNLGSELCKKYDKFMYDNWGKRNISLYAHERDEVEEAILQYKSEDLELYKIVAVEENKLDITSEGSSLSEEDIKDIEIMFDFFDGDVDVQ